MKLYIVLQNLYTSDFNDTCIIGAFVSRKDAETMMECDYHDFNLAIDRGDFRNDFDNIELNESVYPFNANNWLLSLVSDKGYYTTYKIEEIEV